jgi:predicted glycosyltransferase
VPTFSIFTGKRPYLDEYLQENGKLRFIENVGQVGSIPVQRRDRSLGYKAEGKNLALEITELMIELSGRYVRRGTV